MNSGITIQRLFAKQAANFTETLKEAQELLTAEHANLDDYIEKFVRLELMMPTSFCDFISGDAFPNQLAVAEVQIHERLDVMALVAGAIETAAANNEVLVASLYVNAETAECFYPLFGSAREAGMFDIDYQQAKPFLQYVYGE